MARLLRFSDCLHAWQLPLTVPAWTRTRAGVTGRIVHAEQLLLVPRAGKAVMLKRELCTDARSRDVDKRALYLPASTVEMQPSTALKAGNVRSQGHSGILRTPSACDDFVHLARGRKLALPPRSREHRAVNQRVTLRRS